MPIIISSHAYTDVLCLYVGSTGLPVAFYLFCLIRWVRDFIRVKLGVFAWPPHYPCWLLRRNLENHFPLDLFYPPTASTPKLTAFCRCCLLISYDLSTFNCSVLCLLFPSWLVRPQGFTWFGMVSSSVSVLCPVPTACLIHSHWVKPLSFPQMTRWFCWPYRGAVLIQDCSPHHRRYLLLCIASWDVLQPLISGIYLLIFPRPQYKLDKRRDLICLLLNFQLRTVTNIADTQYIFIQWKYNSLTTHRHR